MLNDDPPFFGADFYEFSELVGPKAEECHRSMLCDDTIRALDPDDHMLLFWSEDHFGRCMVSYLNGEILDEQTIKDVQRVMDESETYVAISVRRLRPDGSFPDAPDYMFGVSKKHDLTPERQNSSAHSPATGRVVRYLRRIRL